MAVQARQHQPLRARQAEPAHAAVERRAQQARDVRDHDADEFVGIGHGRSVAETAN